jgi:outer membrane protein TolC
VNLNYTPITENVGGDPLADLSAQNMKWGVTFEMPLLLRKARAGVQLADIKVKDAELQLENKGLMLFQKANIALNDWQTTFEQSSQFDRTVRDYFRLYQAERRKFELGESNLFLVNSRENKYVDSQLKQIEFLIKNQKSILKTEYSLGILAQEVRLLGGG